MGFLGFYTVAEFERLVVFNVSGRFGGVRGPGLVYVPPGQRVERTIDLRETIRDMPDQHCMTKDSVVVIIDPIVFYKIVDPEKTTLTIQDAEAGILNVARTTLRAVVGELDLHEVIGGRETIASQLKDRLSVEAERWGIDITTVEIADLSLQQEVEKAMAERRASIEQAEADRRVTVLNAEAQREGATAESEAMITMAEAEKTAAITKAEGEKQARILSAEGLDFYYQRLAALGAGAETAIRFEHVSALQKFAASPNAKLVIIPSEMKELGSMRDLTFTEAAVPDGATGRGER